MRRPALRQPSVDRFWYEAHVRHHDHQRRNHPEAGRREATVRRCRAGASLPRTPMDTRSALPHRLWSPATRSTGRWSGSEPRWGRIYRLG